MTEVGYDTEGHMLPRAMGQMIKIVWTLITIKTILVPYVPITVRIHT